VYVKELKKPPLIVCGAIYEKKRLKSKATFKISFINSIVMGKFLVQLVL
jgi:hypothetical protein